VKLVLINDSSGEKYLVDIHEETTAKDVIDTLISGGSIKPSPGEGYQWILKDSKGVAFTFAEKISSRFPQKGGGYEVYYEVHLVSRPVMTEFKLYVENEYSGLRYELKIFGENTAGDVINILIEEGLIGPTPKEGYQWVLKDKSGSIINHNDRLSYRASPESGECEAFLAGRPLSGESTELIVIDRLSGKRYVLEGFEESTAEEVIKALSETGLIASPPHRMGYELILIDFRYMEIPHHEKISSVLSSGQNKVFLVARIVGA
jgi:hypothetical protein